MSDDGLGLAEELGDRTVAVIGRCLVGIVDGPFIDDWEFQTVIGLGREEVNEVRRLWPVMDDRQTANTAVVGAIGNLLGYPHGKSLEAHVGVQEQEIREVLDAWRAWMRK